MSSLVKWLPLWAEDRMTANKRINLMRRSAQVDWEHAAHT
jgi:hypothetical protein